MAVSVMAWRVRPMRTVRRAVLVPRPRVNLLPYHGVPARARIAVRGGPATRDRGRRPRLVALVEHAAVIRAFCGTSACRSRYWLIATAGLSARLSQALGYDDPKSSSSIALSAV